MTSSARRVVETVRSVGDGVTLAADEREDWPPIDFAKLGEGAVRLLFVAVRICARQDDAPSSRHEAVGAAGAGRELLPDDGDRLLALDVRAPGYTVASALRRDPIDVGFHDIEVYQQRRGVEGVLRESDGAGVRGHCAPAAA